MKVKRITTRLDKYCELLEHIYGEKIVKAFTTKNEDTLKMNDFANNQIEKKNYTRAEGEGCTKCQFKVKNDKNVTNFFERNLEFPGWIGNLDFSGNSSAKKIMIIGRDPPPLKEQINIAFGLGYYPIKSDGKLDFDQLWKTYSGEKKRVEKIINDQERKNKLWEYLNQLFSGKLDDIKPNIYITDLCKCNNEKNDKDMWKRCRDNYLVKEIELINPNLVIFQGGISYNKVLSYLKDKKVIKSKRSIIEETKRYYPKLGEPDYYDENYSKPCFGKLPLNGKDIYFFKIYHQAAFTMGYLSISDRDNYIKQNRQFIEKKILKEVLK